MRNVFHWETETTAEGFSGEEEHSVEEVQEDLSDEGHKFCSDRMSS